MTMLRPGQSKIQITGGTRDFSSIQNVQPNPLFSEYQASFPGVKWQGNEAEHLSPSSNKVKNKRSCTSGCPICLHDVNRDCFFFVLHCVYTRLGDRQTYEEKLHFPDLTLSGLINF